LLRRALLSFGRLGGRLLGGLFRFFLFPFVVAALFRLFPFPRGFVPAGGCLRFLLLGFLFSLLVDRRLVVVLLAHGVLVVVHGVGCVGEVEERVLFLADIDERGVHSLNDALDTAEEDRAYVAFLVLDFEKYLGEAFILGDCDP